MNTAAAIPPKTTAKTTAAQKSEKQSGTASKSTTKSTSQSSTGSTAQVTEPAVTQPSAKTQQTAPAADTATGKITSAKGMETGSKKATEKNAGDFKEVVFEGYGPHGIAYLVETATDNNTRTVANVRSYFTKCGGSLGTSGSVAFMFDHKCVFRIKEDPAKPIDIEELELELIDFGVEELGVDEEENTIVIYSDFNEAINMQKYLEENGFEIQSIEFVRIPNDTKELTDEQRESVQKLIDKIEEDEDVQNVFTNMAE